MNTRCISTEILETALIKATILDCYENSNDIWIPSGIDLRDVKRVLREDYGLRPVFVNPLADYAEGRYQVNFVPAFGQEVVISVEVHRFYHGGENSGSWFYHINPPKMTAEEIAVYNEWILMQRSDAALELE